MIIDMSDQFKGLPIADLIGGPLYAACKAQEQLARATKAFIESVSFQIDPMEKLPPSVKVDYIHEPGGNLHRMELSLPELTNAQLQEALGKRPTEQQELAGKSEAP
jgi:hypothetical protein